MEDKSYSMSTRETLRRPVPIFLAMMIGTEQAMIISYLNHNITTLVIEGGSRGTRNFKDGRWWYRYTFEQWHRAFPQYCIRSIKTYIAELETLGLLISTQKYNRNGYDRAKWYSVNGTLLDNLLKQGVTKFEEQFPDDSDSANVALSDGAKVAQSKVHGLHDISNHSSKCNGSNTPGISADAELPSPTSSLRSSAGCVQAPPLHPTARKEGIAFPPVSPTPRAAMREGHLATYAERFKKTGSSQALEKVWQITIADKLGSEHFVAFTARDKKNAKSDLPKWCEASNIDTVKFMVWVITNWADIQANLKWAKLPETPTFQQFFGLKDKIAVLYKQIRKKEKAGGIRKVYHSPSDVPMDHPRRADLLKAFKCGAKTVALEEV